MNSEKKFDKENECTPVSVHSLSHDGRGIATIGNKTTFVSGALPTETLVCKITKKHKQYNEADAIEILKSADHRIDPPCTHFGICGGCSLQHMNDQSQMELKQNTLLEQLKHFGKVTPENILAPLHANSIGYRRKARLGVKYVIKKNKLLIGFREKSSRYLADLESCAVLHPSIGKKLTELGELIASLEIYKAIPQIEVAIGDTDIALVFRHMEPISENDEKKLVLFAIHYGFQLYLQPDPPANIQKLWPKDNNERLTYSLPDHHLQFRFYPLDFTQINLEMNRLMVNQALQLLDLKPDDHVLDLFCGIGNFTLPIAKQAKHVTGIEGSEEMVARANDNAAHNQIKNTSFYAANLMDPGLKTEWMKSCYDKILLDPPRAGAKEILPFIAASGATKIVYVSCNPATLARDAGELVHQYGFVLSHAGIMNMFPHTSHIEAMAVFEK